MLTKKEIENVRGETRIRMAARPLAEGGMELLASRFEIAKKFCVLEAEVLKVLGPELVEKARLDLREQSVLHPIPPDPAHRR